MSDYVKEIVVRLPFPKSILEEVETEDPWDCEDYLKEKLGVFFDVTGSKCFVIGSTDSSYYLDWRFYNSYGDESGDYGFSRYLTDAEYNEIKPMFDRIVKEYKREDLRIVDYCYYNGSDAPDYYSVEESDYSGDFI